MRTCLFPKEDLLGLLGYDQSDACELHHVSNELIETTATTYICELIFMEVVSCLFYKVRYIIDIPEGDAEEEQTWKLNGSEIECEEIDPRTAHNKNGLTTPI